MLKIEGLDPGVFDPASVDPETRDYVTQLETTMAGLPLPYTQDVQSLRDAAASGQSLFGPVVYSDLATDRTIDSGSTPGKNCWIASPTAGASLEDNHFRALA